MAFAVGCSTQASTSIPVTSTYTAAPTKTPAPTITPVPTQTHTPTIAPTATWAWHPPGEVVAPILLYHHVAVDHTSEQYNVVPERFAEQMAALDEWGYTAITATHLIRAITKGRELPPRPVVITFDDGHISVYENAFPVMQSYGFPGVTYVVANRLEAEGFTQVKELKEMMAAGWEVGSHGATHTDIVLDPSLIPYEIKESKRIIKKALSVPINTFAYPFGSFSSAIGKSVYGYGYLGGMGLGNGSTHDESSLFYLKRIEVNGGYDLEAFGALLPWSEPPEESP